MSELDESPTQPSPGLAPPFPADLAKAPAKAPLKAAASPLWLAIAFAIVYVVWGSTYLAIRVAVATLPPFLMAGTRFIVAGGILYVGLRVRGVAPPTRTQWLHATITGLTMLTIGNGLVTLAEKTLPSNITALIVAAVPLYMALLDWARPRGKRPAAHVLAGIAVGLGGMALLVLSERGAGSAATEAATASATARAAGVVAVLIAGLGWAFGSLYARYSPRHGNTVMVSAQHMLTGGMGSLVIALVRGDATNAHLSSITVTSVLAFAYLVIFGAILAFSAYGWLVVVSTPSKISTTSFVNPVIAVILGWLLLGETLRPRALAGAGLIVAAVALITLGGKRAARRAPAT